MPESLLMGFDARGLLLHTRAGGASDTRFVHMQADLQAQVTIADRFRVNGSIGYIHQGAAAASITKNADHRLVSRSHWLGVDVGEDKNWLIRAGRMNLPFGIRSIEHTMWVRRDTQTDINAAQQHGASVAYNSEKIRAEFMGILGNFQLSPDAYRERGYSAYFEYVPAEKLAVGVSSLLTHAGQAISSPANAVWRHAHGIFGRYSPTKMLVLSAEADIRDEAGW